MLAGADRKRSFLRAATRDVMSGDNIAEPWPIATQVAIGHTPRAITRSTDAPTGGLRYAALLFTLTLTAKPLALLSSPP